MSKQNPPDFIRGYNYARKVYDKLMVRHSVEEILEFAGALSEGCGENAELARGMAAYCRELARRRAARLQG